MNAAKEAFKGVPKMPSGGGGAIAAVLGLTVGTYGLYNSVVTGNHHSSFRCFFFSYGLWIMDYGLCHVASYL
jgi:hypothetical protein